MLIYLTLLILILIIGFVFAYQAEYDSQDCSDKDTYCTHWVHDNKSRWRHNIRLNDEETIRERIGLFHSVVEWRRTLIMTIIISILLSIIYGLWTCYIGGYSNMCNNTSNMSSYTYTHLYPAILTKFILSFVYIFIIVFFIAMYYDDMWRRKLSVSTDM